MLFRLSTCIDTAPQLPPVSRGGKRRAVKLLEKVREYFINRRGREGAGKCNIIIGLFAALLLFSACASTPPLKRLKAQLASAPEYAIILEDMRDGGTIFTTYHHKYKVVQGNRTWTTDWLEVPKSTYKANANFLGMTLVSKTSSGENSSPHPPGYDYVGNSRYGQWQSNGGRSFWVFYGQYAMMQSLFGLGGRGIYRSDYDRYQTYRTQRRPYYGPNQGYGTKGAITRQTRPSFFARRQAKATAKRERFRQKVRRRVGRSRSMRSRGFGYGK